MLVHLAAASAASTGRPPRHVAIIMDGNGRWATARQRRRTVGHVAGMRAVRRAVEAACRLAIPELTLFAFSSDNWRRPAAEVGALLQLFRRYLVLEAARLRAEGVRLVVVGRRDRLGAELVRLIDHAERATAGGTRLLLRVAIDYSSRDAIVGAAARLSRQHGAATSRERFGAALAEVVHAGAAIPDVDLLVRTGGEQRLSDFLLWECAYAELVFTPCLWPDFDEGDLTAALQTYARRERRFGRVPAAG